MRSFVVVSAALVPLFTACFGGGSDNGDDDGDLTYNCEQETSDDEFLIGMSKTGENGLLSFKLVDFTPAPPARLLNAWTLEVATIAGVAPVENATLDVYPFMPAHGHGAGREVVISPMADAGQYALEEINLHMPGIWEVTITAESNAGTDSVVFRPCIPN